MLKRIIPVVALAAMLFGPAVSQAQFSVLVTGFEHGNANAEFTGPWTRPDFFAEVVFRDPSASGSTRGIVPPPPVSDDTYVTNISLAPSPFSEVHLPGIRSLASFWEWTDPDDHTSWVRLTSNNTEDVPNPSLHLGGEVRMWVAARGFTDSGFGTEAPGANVKLGIGIRETGVGAPLGGNGDTGGDVEWVGLSAKLAEIVAGSNGVCDTLADAGTDDVQIVDVGMAAPNNGTCIDGGTNGLIDSAVNSDDLSLVTPLGMFDVPADGIMRQYVFNLPALEGSGNVFAFTGDGALGATPNNRGTLEHLVLNNDPDDASAAKVILVFIDDIEFESPVLSPPVICEDLDPPCSVEAPKPLDQMVRVTGIDPNADLLEVIQLPDIVLASIDPASETEDVDTGFLPAGIQIVARQTVGVNVSDNSVPVAVAQPGNGPLRVCLALRETDNSDNGLDCATNGTGFDPNNPSTLEWIGATPDYFDGDGVPRATRFGAPNGRRLGLDPEWREIIFNPCTDGIVAFSGGANGVIDVNSVGLTHGVWEGLYFRIDELSPTAGPFTVFIDDLEVRNAGGQGVDCVIDDFDSYTPATGVPAGNARVGDFIIEPGGSVAGGTAGNLTADSTAVGDDVQVRTGSVDPGEIIVGPGPNGVLDTEPGGDDVIDAFHARFNNPGAAGASVGVANEPDRSAVTGEDFFSPPNSLKVEWAFINGVDTENTMRLTSNEPLDPVTLVGIPAETFIGFDPVVELTHASCDDGIDLEFRFMLKLAPPPIPGDCDGDGDVDLEDGACFQQCFGESPVPFGCGKVDIAPLGAPDDAITLDDYELFAVLLTGPKSGYLGEVTAGRSGFGRRSGDGASQHPLARFVAVGPGVRLGAIRGECRLGEWGRIVRAGRKTSPMRRVALPGRHKALPGPRVRQQSPTIGDPVRASFNRARFGVRH